MERTKLNGMVFAALFAALTAAVAWFKIPLPFTPVPITLQTLVVLLSGAMLGPYYGAISMILYLTVGAIGLPVFAGGGSGLGALLGPTGGYLFSYPIAAFVIGLIIKKEQTKKTANSASLKSILINFAMLVFGLLVSIILISILAVTFSSYTGNKLPLLLLIIKSTINIFRFKVVFFLIIFSLSYLTIRIIIGKVLEKKELKIFFKYLSLAVILAFVIITALDSIFKIGILRMGDKTMISLLSENQREILIIVSLAVFFLYLMLIVYLRKMKSPSTDIILSMFTGTLIIYLFGSIQGKIVTGLPWNAILLGWVLPFIVGDTVKLLLAASIAKSVDIKNYLK